MGCISTKARKQWGQVVADAEREAQPTEDSDWLMRDGAAGVSRNSGGSGASLSLQKNLEDDNPYLRGKAAEALGNAGSSDAVPALLECLKDDHPYVRGKAAEALGEIRSADAVPALLNSLKDDPDVQREAANALGNIGSTDAVPALQETLTSYRPSVRIKAVEALGKIGTPAGPALKRSLRDDDPSVRGKAAEALGKTASCDAVPALQNSLRDENPTVRAKAAEALGKLGNTDALPALQESLHDNHPYVRGKAAIALGNIGSLDAVPALQKGVDDDVRCVRRKAIEALWKLGCSDAVPAWRDSLKRGSSTERGPPGAGGAGGSGSGGVLAGHGSGAAAKTKGVGQAMPLEDEIVGGEGTTCIISFPGKRQDEWNNMVVTVRLLQALKQELEKARLVHQQEYDDDFRECDSEREDSKCFNPGLFSTACVFLPDGDVRFGQHVRNYEDHGECYCAKLYGEKAEWGCRWFDVWMRRVRKAVERRQRLVVVYEAGEAGEGDDGRGLGRSQRGEVAWVCKQGFDFDKIEVGRLQAEILQHTFDYLSKLSRGPKGAQALVDAIMSCRDAQEGLRSLCLSSALGEAGTIKLSKVLPALAKLEQLRLSFNLIGEVGIMKLAEALPALPQLVVLDLSLNSIGEAGARALAAALPNLPSLTCLSLMFNRISEEGRKVLEAAKKPETTIYF